MKKILTFGIVSIFILSGMYVVSETGKSDCNPGISLPTEYITMVAEYGTDSYFNFYLSNVPPGYDVSDGLYPGWCVQRDFMMDQGVLLTVILYSSYDPDMPLYFQDEDWDKVNYILNNKQGGRMDIQDAIWYFIGDKPYSSYWTEQMVLDANENGEGFCPGPGEIMAVLIDNDGNLIYNVQRSILEIVLSDYEGCTPGFWKNPKHFEHWVNYHPLNTVGNVFNVPDELSCSGYLSSQFLIRALYFGGGSGVFGGAKLLLHHAVAALLNAAHPDVSYFLTEGEIITAVNNALASLDRDTMLNLKDTLDYNNNLCSDLCCD